MRAARAKKLKGVRRTCKVLLSQHKIVGCVRGVRGFKERLPLSKTNRQPGGFWGIIPYLENTPEPTRDDT